MKHMLLILLLGNMRETANIVGNATETPSEQACREKAAEAMEILKESKQNGFVFCVKVGVTTEKGIGA